MSNLTVVNQTTSLVAGYLSAAPSKAQQKVTSVWNEVFGAFKAATDLVDGLFDKRVLVAETRFDDERDFFNLAFRTLRERALFPLERDFLRELMQASNSCGKSLHLFKVRTDNPIVADILKMPSGSCAGEITLSAQSQAPLWMSKADAQLLYRDTKAIGIFLYPKKTDTYCLFEDWRGVRYLRKIDFGTTVMHELIHGYHRLTNRTYKEDIACARALSNGEECMTIQGWGWTHGRRGCPSEKVCIPYSEHAFARARGEMVRLSHGGYQIPDDYPHLLFIKALEMGANGTMRELMVQSILQHDLRMIPQDQIPSYVEFTSAFGMKQEPKLSLFQLVSIVNTLEAPSFSEMALYNPRVFDHRFVNDYEVIHACLPHRIDEPSGEKPSEARRSETELDLDEAWDESIKKASENCFYEFLHSLVKRREADRATTLATLYHAEQEKRKKQLEPLLKESEALMKKFENYRRNHGLIFPSQEREHKRR